MTRQTAALARPTTGLARIGQRIADVLAECDYAQRRWFTVMTTPDSYLTKPDQAPDDYAEFLFRTSNSLQHEPTAADRVDGRRAA